MVLSERLKCTGGREEPQGPPREGWEAVGGSQEAVRQLQEVVLLPLLYPGLFKSLHVQPPRCVACMC